MKRENTDLKYTLLFGGGAIRGVAYCGALKAIEELNIQFNTIAGSSVGAVFAGLISVGYNAQETREVMFDVSFELFKDIQLAIGPQFALSKGEVFLEWLRDKIESKFYGDKYEKGKNKAVTFKDLDKNLIVITTDLSNFECKEFSKYTTPDFEVATAIRISSGMPGLMKPYEYNNTLLVDGDLQKSAPMWSLTKNLQPEDERILELRLEGNFKGNDHNAVEYLNAIYSYATRTGTKFLTELYGAKDGYDYITLETGDLNIVNFNVSNEIREQLINNGYEQTIKYFKNNLVKKKQNLLNIYKETEKYLTKCSKEIAADNISKAKETLGELYIEISNKLNILSDWDKKCLEDFKDTLIQNIHYPILFGKIKLKNKALVEAKLTICLNKWADKIQEYQEYIALNSNY